MRIGLVGYGTGGRHFHAPFIVAAEGVELAGVVARSPARVAEVKEDLPGVPIYDSIISMIDAGVQAVTITTPPQARRALVLEAIAAGLHVIADKPFAPNAEGGRVLDAAAKAKGVLLGVFHNRRYDAAFAHCARYSQADN
jgi:predicted dehydrogenase